MFLIQSNEYRFTPRNENEQKLLEYMKRNNDMVAWRKFNDFEINEDERTVSIALQNGIKTTISIGRLSEVLGRGKVAYSKGASALYANISAGGGTKRKDNLSRFLLRDELELYEGFEDATGLKLVVHHIDEDTLNNVDGNLVVVTNSENVLHSSLNRSKGFAKSRGKFNVSVSNKYLGRFDTKEEARAIYVAGVKTELKRLEDVRINWLEGRGVLS